MGEAQSRRRAPLLPLPLPSAPGISPDGATLKLRGLPYSAGVNDITNWLSGIPSSAAMTPEEPGSSILVCIAAVTVWL